MEAFTYAPFTHTVFRNYRPRQHGKYNLGGHTAVTPLMLSFSFSGAGVVNRFTCLVHSLQIAKGKGLWFSLVLPLPLLSLRSCKIVLLALLQNFISRRGHPISIVAVLILLSCRCFLSSPAPLHLCSSVLLALSTAISSWRCH